MHGGHGEQCAARSRTGWRNRDRRTEHAKWKGEGQEVEILGKVADENETGMPWKVEKYDDG